MPPKGMKGRRTKTEIQQEFSVIAEELAENRASTSAKETISQQLKEVELQEAVSGISVEVVVHKLADLGSEIAKSLSSISEKLVGEVSLLTQVRNAVALENAQLQKLHNADIVATSIHQLLEDYKEKKELLETEARVTRALWEKEQEERAQSISETEQSAKKAREREAEEYAYKRDLERKKAQDQFQEENRLKEKQNREKQEALEKSWQQREEAQQAQEKNLQDLQASVANFPLRLKEETEKARQEAIQQTEQRLSQQLFVLQKDSESERKMAAMKIESFRETITREQEQLARLQKQLEEAKKEVKEIAEKAIEGASGAKALSHINQIAIEQAKNLK